MMGYVRQKRTANGFPTRLTDVHGNIPDLRSYDPGPVVVGRLTTNDFTTPVCACGFHVCGCDAKKNGCNHCGSTDGTHFRCCDRLSELG